MRISGQLGLHDPKDLGACVRECFLSGNQVVFPSSWVTSWESQKLKGCKGLKGPIGPDCFRDSLGASWSLNKGGGGIGWGTLRFSEKKLCVCNPRCFPTHQQSPPGWRLTCLGDLGSCKVGLTIFVNGVMGPPHKWTYKWVAGTSSALQVELSPYTHNWFVAAHLVT